jgi:hypothetical protein
MKICKPTSIALGASVCDNILRGMRLACSAPFEKMQLSSFGELDKWRYGWHCHVSSMPIAGLAFASGPTVLPTAR